VIWEGQTKKLFPKTIYSLESGGDPKEIIKLKYKELKSYHEDFYHPSNSILYFYGDLNIEKIFEYLEKEFFQFFKKKKINSKISKPKKIKERVKTKIKYFSENENENILSFNFVIGDSLNQKEILKNQILLNILLGSDSSIFKKKLLETGLISKIETHIETDLNTVF
jgi:Zn-dependent M16 (insulinase) family peptidase